MAAKEAAGEVSLRQERVNDHPHPATTERSRSHIGIARAAAEFHSWLVNESGVKHEGCWEYWKECMHDWLK